MISLGLDSGSSMTKAVLLEDTKIIDTKMIPTSISPRKSLEFLYREIKKTTQRNRCYCNNWIWKESVRSGRFQDHGDYLSCSWSIFYESRL